MSSFQFFGFDDQEVQDKQNKEMALCCLDRFQAQNTFNVSKNIEIQITLNINGLIKLDNRCWWTSGEKNKFKKYCLLIYFLYKRKEQSIP